MELSPASSCNRSSSLASFGRSCGHKNTHKLTTAEYVKSGIKNTIKNVAYQIEASTDHYCGWINDLMNPVTTQSVQPRFFPCRFSSRINLWINIWFMCSLILWSDKVICQPRLWRGHKSGDGGACGRWKSADTRVTLLQSPQTWNEALAA